MKTKRFNLRTEPDYGWYRVTDTESGISIRFKEREFNETQDVSIPNDFPADPQMIARIMQLMGDWLFRHCYSVIFPPREYEVRFDEDTERIMVIRHVPPRFILSFEDDCTLSEAIEKVKAAAAFMKGWQERNDPNGDL